MKQLFTFFFLLFVSIAIGQELRYSKYDIRYHRDYKGERQTASIETTNEYGQQVPLFDKYNDIKIKITQDQVEIICTGELGNRSVYKGGIQEKISGSNWYGYRLAGDHLLKITNTTAYFLSEPKKEDPSIYLIEEVYFSAKKF